MSDPKDGVFDIAAKFLILVDSPSPPGNSPRYVEYVKFFPVLINPGRIVVTTISSHTIYKNALESLVVLLIPSYTSVAM